MKKKCLVLLVAASLFVSSLMVPPQNAYAAEKTEETEQVTKICLDEVLSYYGRLGETRQLHVLGLSKGMVETGVIWTSSNEKVVKVNEKGQITSVGNGTAIITVALKSNPDVKATTKVVVSAPGQKEKLVVCRCLLTLNKVGESNTLTLCKGSATTNNEDCIWESSNESVATIDEQGKVTAVGAGLAIVTVTSKENPALTAQTIVLVRIDGKCGCGCGCQ